MFLAYKHYLFIFSKYKPSIYEVLYIIHYTYRKFTEAPPVYDAVSHRGTSEAALCDKSSALFDSVHLPIPFKFRTPAPCSVSDIIYLQHTITLLLPELSLGGLVLKLFHVWILSDLKLYVE